MRSTALLRRKILSRRASVAVLGQGYVGLTLACVAADAGFPVTGIDIDPERVESLNAGKLTVPGVSESIFRAGVDSKRLNFEETGVTLGSSDVIVICVNTPVRDHAPDLSFIESASKEVASHFAAGALVILESTTYPGTTEEIVRPLLEESGLVAGKDFLLAYSPERINPGDLELSFREVPKVVGGLTSESTGAVELFYGQLVDEVIAVSSCRAAELSKLLENTYRHVNVALVNEMAMFCHAMEIDVWEVIAAAATKPFGFMPFYPGPGVGGHCIAIDPTFLAWQVRRDAGRQFRILEQAQDVNAQMPAYVASRVGGALNEVGKSVKGSGLMALGVAYKPGVGDIRESPALEVIDVLRRQGANVTFHDPLVQSFSLSADLPPRVELTEKAIGAADCVLILTPHASYDFDWVAEHARLVFDARNALGKRSPANVIRL